MAVLFPFLFLFLVLGLQPGANTFFSIQVYVSEEEEEEEEEAGASYDETGLRHTRRKGFSSSSPTSPTTASEEDEAEEDEEEGEEGEEAGARSLRTAALRCLFLAGALDDEVGWPGGLRCFDLVTFEFTGNRAAASVLPGGASLTRNSLQKRGT